MDLTATFIDLLSGFPPFFVILIISMIPVIELRGAIPAGILIYDMNPLYVFLLAVIGNMIPVTFIFYLIRPVSDFLSARSSFCRRFFDYFFARAERNGKSAVEKYKDLALTIFVGIPLPMTGAWSGTLVALVFGYPFRKAFFSIMLGVVIAGIIVTLLTVSGLTVWDALRML